MRVGKKNRHVVSGFKILKTCALHTTLGSIVKSLEYDVMSNGKQTPSQPVQEEDCLNLKVKDYDHSRRR